MPNHAHLHCPFGCRVQRIMCSNMWQKEANVFYYTAVHKSGSHRRESKEDTSYAAQKANLQVLDWPVMGYWCVMTCCHPGQLRPFDLKGSRPNSTSMVLIQYQTIWGPLMHYDIALGWTTQQPNLPVFVPCFQQWIAGWILDELNFNSSVKLSFSELAI